MPDLFFYRAPEDIEKQEQQEREVAELQAATKNQESESVPFIPDAPELNAEDNWAEGVPSKTTDFPAKTEDWDKPAPAAAAGGEWAEQGPSILNIVSYWDINNLLKGSLA